jgi:hypothetical protein
MLVSAGLEYHTLLCRSCTLRYDVIAVHYNLRYYLNTEIMQMEQREPSNKYIVFSWIYLVWPRARTSNCTQLGVSANFWRPRLRNSSECSADRHIWSPNTNVCLDVACASKPGGEEIYREHSSKKRYHLMSTITCAVVPCGLVDTDFFFSGVGLASPGTAATSGLLYSPRW